MVKGYYGRRQEHSMNARSIRTKQHFDARGFKMHGIKELWVVTKPGTFSTSSDILFDSDISHLLEEVERGVLTRSEIIGVYTSADDARDATLTALYNKQVKNTSWESFFKNTNMHVMDMQMFAEDMGYDSLGELTVSLSPSSLYKKNKEQFVKVINDLGNLDIQEKRDTPTLILVQEKVEKILESSGVIYGQHARSRYNTLKRKKKQGMLPDHLNAEYEWLEDVMYGRVSNRNYNY